MLSISEILLQHRELNDFATLVKIIKDAARNGEIFLEFDVRPPFPDTPEDWQERLETAFTAVSSVES